MAVSVSKNLKKILRPTIKDWMIIKFQHLAILFLLLFLSGCASLTQGNFSALAVKTESRALTCENRGELRQALYYWRILEGLRPGDKKISRKIGSLSEQLHYQADKHYHVGLQLQHDGRPAAAGNEFIKALAADPDHKQAFISLQRITRPAAVIYNPVPKKIITPRKMLTTPAVAEKSPARDKIKTRRVVKEISSPGLVGLWLTKAEYNLRREQYSKCLALIAEVEKIKPGNSAAGRIKKAVAYQQGRKQLPCKDKSSVKLKKFEQSRAEPEIDQAIKETPVDNGRAESHYQQGLKYFLQENLEQAISEWETALKYNPHHRLAVRDLANARILLKNLNNIQ